MSIIHRLRTAATVFAVSALAGAGAYACSGGGAVETVTVSKGTVISGTLDQKLDTETSSKGDEVTATVSMEVAGPEGVLIPSGSKLHGHVTAVQKPSGGRPGALKIQFTSLEVRGSKSDVQAVLTDASPKTRKELQGEGKKIGGGAAAGALIGGLIGGGAKEAVLGAAAGAAAGTAVTLGTKDAEAYLPAGSPIKIRLTSAVDIPTPEQDQ